MKIQTLLIALILPTTLLAEDLTTVSGKKYTGVTVNRVEADGLAISHDDGLAKVPFSDLSEELRKKYGYDPQKAAQYQAAMQAAAAQRAAAANAAAATQGQQQAQQKKIAEQSKEMRVEVIQVLPKGALVDPLRSEAIASASARIGGGGYVGTAYRLSGKVAFVQGITGDVTDSKRFYIQAYRDGNYTYEDTSGAQRTIEKWIFVKHLKEE